MTIATKIATPRKRASAALVRFAWGVLGFMVLVSLWGAVVRATGSGAGCGANWPLCNGLVWPLHHPRIATIIEFTHRSMSGAVTFLVVGLIAWTFFGTRKGSPARKSAVATGIFLVIEALLGAVLVLKHLVEDNTSNLRTLMQSIHFSNTMLLLATLALTALFLKRDRLALPTGTAAPGLALAAWVLLGATLIAGATGALAALADTLFPATDLWTGLRQDFVASSPLLIRMRWLHPAAALIALALIILLVRKVQSRATKLLLAMVLLQIVLGTLDVVLLAPTWMQVLHLLGADLYWIVLVLFATDAILPTREPALGA